MLGQGKKLATKKAMKRKKVVTLKNQTMFGLIYKDNAKNMDTMGAIIVNNTRSHENYCINSFCKTNSEEEIKDMIMVKMEIIGQPIVKTTREITIKK